MAILKFINDRADFSSLNASVSASNIYFSGQRVDGWSMVLSQSATMNWPESTNDTCWMHYTGSFSSSNVNWDDDGVFTFTDLAVTTVLQMNIADGFIEWDLIGDTTERFVYQNVADTLLVMDVQFIRNGTTDITVNVYVNGAFQGTATVANTNDVGTPVAMNITNEDTNSGGAIYFGECVIADEDTRGWRLYQLKPTAFGVHQEWLGDASSVVDGSLLTGISTDVADDLASFGVTNIENIADTTLIDRIAIQTYGQRGASGLTAFNHYFRYEDAAIENDTDRSLELTATLVMDEYLLDPRTSLAWEVDDIQGLQIGVRART